MAYRYLFCIGLLTILFGVGCGQREAEVEPSQSLPPTVDETVLSAIEATITRRSNYTCRKTFSKPHSVKEKSSQQAGARRNKTISSSLKIKTISKKLWSKV